MERRWHSTLNSQIYEEATNWFIECRTGDLNESARRAFDQWLRKSPEHQAAYLEILALWDAGSRIDPKRDAGTLISQALQDCGNVVPLPSAGASKVGTRVSSTPEVGFPDESHDTLVPVPPASSAPQPDMDSAPPSVPRSRSSAHRWRFAAALVVLGVGAGTWFAFFAPLTYVTAISEQRSIELEDGSMVELNSRSKVAVHFSSHERDITLVSGQALFRVAKDPSRPFIVTSDGTRVRAVGTQFDVYKKDFGTIVTVLEGRVAILPSLAQTASTPLCAGEQVTVRSNSVQRMEHPNVGGATAWTAHKLIFVSASLAEVVEEFNRYNRRPLVIEGPGLDTFHLSGVFSSTDPGSLIQFLRDRPGLRVVETPTEVRIEKKTS